MAQEAFKPTEAALLEEAEKFATSEAWMDDLDNVRDRLKQQMNKNIHFLSANEIQLLEDTINQRHQKISVLQAKRRQEQLNDWIETGKEWRETQEQIHLSREITLRDKLELSNLSRTKENYVQNKDAITDKLADIQSTYKACMSMLQDNSDLFPEGEKEKLERQYLRSQSLEQQKLLNRTLKKHLEFKREVQRELLQFGLDLKNLHPDFQDWHLEDKQASMLNLKQASKLFSNPDNKRFISEERARELMLQLAHSTPSTQKDLLNKLGKQLKKLKPLHKVHSELPKQYQDPLFESKTVEDQEKYLEELEKKLFKELLAQLKPEHFGPESMTFAIKHYHRLDSLKEKIQYIDFLPKAIKEEKKLFDKYKKAGNPQLRKIFRHKFFNGPYDNPFNNSYEGKKQITAEVQRIHDGIKAYKKDIRKHKKSLPADIYQQLNDEIYSEIVFDTDAEAHLEKAHENLQKKLKPHLDQAQKFEALKKVAPNLHGKLKEIFYQATSEERAEIIAEILKNHQTVLTLTQTAVQLEKLDNLELAISTLKQILDIFPGHKETLNFIARLEKQLQHPETTENKKKPAKKVAKIIKEDPQVSQEVQKAEFYDKVINIAKKAQEKRAGTTAQERAVNDETDQDMKQIKKIMHKKDSNKVETGRSNNPKKVIKISGRETSEQMRKIKRDLEDLNQQELNEGQLDVLDFVDSSGKTRRVDEVKNPFDLAS